MPPPSSYSNGGVTAMRRWLNIFMALTILTLTLFSIGCAGTSSYTECEGPAFSANSNCMNNLRYYEMFGY